mmetsp:Transcript_65651/g.183108  ORF Transcript_65651/g.183108 Transcript_65651/m.183108 type:complete len:236 (-) Transcript_65651:39-746(-)
MVTHGDGDVAGITEHGQPLRALCSSLQRRLRGRLDVGVRHVRSDGEIEAIKVPHVGDPVLIFDVVPEQPRRSVRADGCGSGPLPHGPVIGVLADQLAAGLPRATLGDEVLRDVLQPRGARLRLAIQEDRDVPTVGGDLPGKRPDVRVLVDGAVGPVDDLAVDDLGQPSRVHGAELPHLGTAVGAVGLGAGRGQPEGARRVQREGHGRGLKPGHRYGVVVLRVAGRLGPHWAFKGR